MSDDLVKRLQSLIEWLEEDPDNIHHLPADQVAKLRAWLNIAALEAEVARLRELLRMARDVMHDGDVRDEIDAALEGN